MTLEQKNRASKFLSLVLRHEPERIGLQLDAAGWTEVDQLLVACAQHGLQLDREQLQEIVTTNDKKRFAFSEDGMRIRASQGHSVPVDLQYTPQTPPEKLYHGTAIQTLPSIRSQGLRKMDRHHVHLSLDPESTMKVAQRRGRPRLLVIRAREMHRQGHLFYLSANQVWLTDSVPREFIDFPDEPGTSP